MSQQAASRVTTGDPGPEQHLLVPGPRRVSGNLNVRQQRHSSELELVRGRARRMAAPNAASALLESAGLGGRLVTFPPRAVIFSQGGPCDSVMCVRTGEIQITVKSATGKLAVIGQLRPGDFLGESALTAHPVRLETATATVDSTVLVVPTNEMSRRLRVDHAFSDRFIAHMLARNARLEADLIDQLFNSSEKRLARTLLLLARCGKGDSAGRVVPKVSQETLSHIVGTTRSRVNFFLKKFKRLGFIEYDASGLAVRQSLLTVVLHE